MWNSIVRRFTLDDEFSFLLLNLSISRISIPGKFSLIFYILTQLEWSWPSVTITVPRATSFPWEPSSSPTRPPRRRGLWERGCSKMQFETIQYNVTGSPRRISNEHLRIDWIGAGRFISLPTEIFGNFCWMSLFLILHTNFFEPEKKD